MSRSLDAIVAAIPPKVFREASVDVTEFCGGEPTEFTFREPSIPALTQAVADGDLLRKDNPLWPKSLAIQVAVLAISHVAPEAEAKSRGALYASIVNDAPELWTKLFTHYATAFPSVIGYSPDSEEAKNE